MIQAREKHKKIGEIQGAGSSEEKPHRNMRAVFKNKDIAD